jgi:DNA-binding transcriptional MerR regulator
MASSTKTLKCTIAEVEEIGTRLDALIASGPPKTRQASKSEAAELLAARLKKMRNLGYSIDEIVKILRDEHKLDLGVSAIARASQRRDETPKKRGRKRQATAEKLVDAMQDKSSIPLKVAQHTRSQPDKILPQKPHKTAVEAGNLFGNPSLKNDDGI